MVQVIMMCGICGSGKTTFSKKKEIEEGYTRLSIDEMVWNQYGKFGENYSKDKYREILDNVDKQIQLKLTQLIKNGKNVIIDSSFWSKSKREQYRNLIKDESNGLKEPITIQLIYLKADYDTLHKRLKIRNQNINENSPFIITDEILTHHFGSFEEPINEDEIIILQK